MQVLQAKHLRPPDHLFLNRGRLEQVNEECPGHREQLSLKAVVQALAGEPLPDVVAADPQFLVGVPLRHLAAHNQVSD